MKWIRRAVLFLLLAGVVASVALAFRTKPVSVETTTVDRGPFVETIDEPGKTRVRERFVVSAPVTGELARISLRAGDAVEADQVIASIRAVSPPMQDARTRAELEARLRSAQAAHVLATAAVEKARALEVFARREAARAVELVETGSAPTRDREKAELNLLVATKDVRTAELSARVAAFDLDVARAAIDPRSVAKPAADWSVRAPLKGRILHVLQPNGGVVAAGTPLLEIADPTDLEVVAQLLTADAVRVAPGARATLERWGGEGPLEGRVRAVEPSGYTKVSALGVEEQRVDVVINLASPQRAWAALGDGFRVQTRIVVHHADDVVRTAAASLFRDGDAWAVFVVEDGRAHKRRVSVERRSGLEAVLGDVDPGTRVVAFPSSDLGDGARVTLR